VAHCFLDIKFNTFMAAGSYGLFAPLMFFGKLYSNSQMISNDFNWINLLIDLIIVCGIPILFSLKKNRRK